MVFCCGAREMLRNSMITLISKIKSFHVLINLPLSNVITFKENGQKNSKLANVYEWVHRLYNSCE